jgi:hypothetical protein
MNLSKSVRIPFTPCKQVPPGPVADLKWEARQDSQSRKVVNSVRCPFSSPSSHSLPTFIGPQSDRPKPVERHPLYAITNKGLVPSSRGGMGLALASVWGAKREPFYSQFPHEPSRWARSVASTTPSGVAAKLPADARSAQLGPLPHAPSRMARSALFTTPSPGN